jgi:hypothetical protein
VTGIVVACPCGEVYELKPEYAGRLLECPVCHRHLRAGGLPGAIRRSASTLDPAFERDAFLLRERVLTIRSKYEVWAGDGTPILYVERPTYPVRTLIAYLLGVLAAGAVMAIAARFVSAASEPIAAFAVLLAYGVSLAAFVVVSMSARPLRHVTIYRDDSRAQPMLRILQNERVAVLTRSYTVLDATGGVLSVLRKHYVHNVIRKRWYVESPGGLRVAMALEESIVLSLLRRVVGSLFGLLRTNFVLIYLEGGEGQVVGEFNRKFTLLDRYVLDLSGDPERKFDRRVALALGIMLDTGERR